MSNKPRRAEELVYFNAIACLIVIFIHVVSYGIVTVDPTSVQAAIIYFPWLLAACVVPAFLFSGAVKMGMQYEENFTLQKYTGYIVGRLKKIYAPYAAWNLIYYAVFVIMGYYALSATFFLRQMLIGTLSSPFYYIVITMQFYLLKPVWLWIMRHIPWYITIPGALIVTFASFRLNAILGLFGTSFTYTDRIFTTYLIFWMIGLYAGRNWDALTESLVKARAGIIAAVAAILGYALVPYANYRGFWLFETTDMKIISDCLSIIVLLWICLKLCSAAESIKKALRFISASSFSVYLSHCLFLTVAEYFIRHAGLTKISVILVIRFLVCYSFPFALYAITSRLGTWARTKLRAN